MTHTRMAEWRSKELWERNKYVCRIPQVPAYMPYPQWNALENKELTFSVFPGKSVVFAGTITENLSHAESSNELRAQHPESFVVNTFTDNTFVEGLEHYKLGGS